MSVEILNAKEVIRAIGTILVKVECPRCEDQLLIGASLGEFLCESCGHRAETIGIDFEKASKRNLVSWGAKSRRVRIGKKIVQALYSAQEGFCAYCDSKLLSYHVEHVTPLAIGGTNKISNLVLSCPPCNLTAGQKSFASFMAKKEFIVSKMISKMRPNG